MPRTARGQRAIARARARLRRSTTATLLAALLACATSASAGAALPVSVTPNPLAPGHVVPQRFLGLSFEAAALTQLTGYAKRGNLVAMLRSLGPGMLRFGGITADENVAWADAQTPRPAWASSVIGPAQMRALGELARRSGWQVLLTVGLAHYEPLAAAREVAAAHKALGPYLAAVEVGNEPNAYASHGFRESPWLAQTYEEEISAYRSAIAALTPGVPFAGPDVSGSGVFIGWGEADALVQRPAMLTGHHYPLGCAQTPAPSIELLLSSLTRGREARSLATYMALQPANEIPVRIDEAGSVSCGGVAGISNTFASALWATSYITQTMTAGTAGINLQGNPTNCVGYTPLCAPDVTATADGALRAQPDWYALQLTSSLVGSRPLPTAINAPSSPNLTVASFLAPNHQVQVVLVDNEAPGASPLAVSLHVPATASSASVLTLTGPSPTATGDVRIAGRAMPANGTWVPPAHPPTLAAHGGAVQMQLAPSTAALITTLPPKPRRAHRRHR